MAFEAIALISVILPVFLILMNGFHIIEEGHVGIYFRGGALLDDITEPGYHFKLPIVTSYHNVQVTV